MDARDDPVSGVGGSLFGADFPHVPVRADAEFSDAFPREDFPAFRFDRADVAFREVIAAALQAVSAANQGVGHDRMETERRLFGINPVEDTVSIEHALQSRVFCERFDDRGERLIEGGARNIKF